MAKYRKIPVIIEAEPYRKGLEDGFECNPVDKEGYLKACPAMLNDIVCNDCELSQPYIETLEGNMFIEPTDMIITGVKGERYPCKKDIFDMTYEKVDG